MNIIAFSLLLMLTHNEHIMVVEDIAGLIVTL